MWQFGLAFLFCGRFAALDSMRVNPVCFDKDPGPREAVKEVEVSLALNITCLQQQTCI